jgi:hypothetical protein
MPLAFFYNYVILSVPPSAWTLPPFGLRRRPPRAKSSAPEAPTARKGSVGDRRGGEKSRLPALSVCASLPYLKCTNIDRERSQYHWLRRASP